MLTLHDLDDARFASAVAFLRDGDSFRYDGIAFRLLGDSQVECAVESSWFLENVSEETARTDFARANAVFHRFLADPRFREVVGTRRPTFVLLCGSEKSWVAVCESDGATMRWVQGMPQRDGAA